MLYDMTSMACFYTSGNFYESEPLTCSYVTPVSYAWGILPSWWRMMQCIKRNYNDRSNTNQLINAFKYFWGTTAGVMSMMYKIEGRYRGPDSNSSFKYTNWYILYLTVQSIYTLYGFCWDVYMDWGLLRSKEKGKYGLRDKLYFQTWFYYYAMVSNILFYCTWCITAPLDPK